MNRIIVYFLCLILLLTITGCGREQKYQVNEVAMDTIIQMTIYDKNAQAAADKSLAELHRLDKLLNSYSADSEINKINQSAGQAVQVSSDTLHVVVRALEYARMTNGAFDPTIGSISKLWGIGKKDEFVPTAAQVQAALQTVNYKKVVVDQQNSTVMLQPGMSLDLGGVAKSYILEQMLQILKDQGVQSALINGGGDVLVLGKRADGKPWRIGVQDPRKPDGMIDVIDLDKFDQASTSGDYQRFFIKDGVRYHHIFDPKTGYPSKGLISATVIGKQSEMDLPSNVLMVLGQEQARRFMQANHPNMRVILVDEQGQVSAW